MSSKAVETVNLSKVYKLYNKKSDRLKEFFMRGKRHSDFAALNNVSFSLMKGETIGIIGENGAGKSTLLQLIAGTLSPTSGTIYTDGRVLALLELGVGFHPDFTGRDNIFFYGDILGLPRSFVNARFKKIVDFSELGEFIHRPIKTYSTGMLMRLAFSLISFLDPEILIIDEALSVGDIHFQQKCIDRITDFKDKGVTIIFCSHSNYQVSILCDRAIWLKNGTIEMDDKTEKVIPAYEFYQLGKEREKQEQNKNIALSNDYPVIIKEFEMLNELPFKRGGELKFRLLIECLKDELPYNVTLSIKMDNGRGIFVTGTHLSGRKPLSGKIREVIISYPNAPLMGGIYYAVARVLDEKGLMVFFEKPMQPFEVIKDSLELGICHFENRWEVH